MMMLSGTILILASAQFFLAFRFADLGVLRLLLISLAFLFLLLGTIYFIWGTIQQITLSRVGVPVQLRQEKEENVETAQISSQIDKDF